MAAIGRNGGRQGFFLKKKIGEVSPPPVSLTFTEFHDPGWARFPGPKPGRLTSGEGVMDWEVFEINGGRNHPKPTQNWVKTPEKHFRPGLQRA